MFVTYSNVLGGVSFYLPKIEKLKPLFSLISIFW